MSLRISADHYQSPSSELPGTRIPPNGDKTTKISCVASQALLQSTTSDGRIFKGTREGKGTCTWPEKEYTGTFVHGLREGQGEMMWWSADHIRLVYEGAFSNDLANGFGALTIIPLNFDSENDPYPSLRGDWKDGKLVAEESKGSGDLFFIFGIPNLIP